MADFDAGFEGAIIESQPTLYSSRYEVESILSECGIDLRIDDDDDSLVSEQEECYLVDAIEEATDDINFAAGHFYTEDVLSTSRWVRRKASYLAAHIIARRRGNPGAYCDIVDKIHKQLEEIRRGVETIPRLGTSGDFQPRMSNLTVDRRYGRRKLRVDPFTSVGKTDSRQDLNHYWVYYAARTTTGVTSGASGAGIGTWIVG